jgi:hypothetical protein
MTGLGFFSVLNGARGEVENATESNCRVGIAKNEKGA